MAKKQMTPISDRPSYLQNVKSERGSEDIKSDDLIIPRLEIAQALSPAQMKKDELYIEGCEMGMVYNNVTRELYGEEVIVCPVVFRKEVLLWRDRKDGGGGGFHGAYPDLATAEAARADLERSEKVEPVDTHQHFCLLIKDDSVQEVVISMSRSKMKVSRGWNSIIRINEGDRFSRLYKITTFTDKNQAGDEYLNFKVSNFGYVSEEIYKRAEELYNSIRSGAATVDRTVENYGEQQQEEF